MHMIFERRMLGGKDITSEELAVLAELDVGEKRAKQIINDASKAATSVMRQYGVGEFLTETRVNPGERLGREDFWGTADLIAADLRTLTLLVGDLKTGRGRVDVEFNDQLLSYALGALGLEAAFGLGGIHTKDVACVYDGISYDVASLYPHIIMHPDCAPTHLDEAQFHSIYGRLIDRRLEAKRAGDKATSNALKLVLNSCFGAYNFAFSLLYSPDAFLSITVSGQLCLLALADRVKRLNH